MIFQVFGHRSEAVFSSPVSPSDEPTLGVEPGSKIPPHLGPKIPEKSSGTGIVAFFKDIFLQEELHRSQKTGRKGETIPISDDFSGILGPRWGGVFDPV